MKNGFLLLGVMTDLLIILFVFIIARHYHGYGMFCSRWTSEYSPVDINKRGSFASLFV